MITKAQNSSGCESKVYNITPESCFDKRVEDFRIKEIEFNPITKKLIIKQSPDVVISTDILQLNDVSEPTHLSPVEDIVDNIPSNAESGVSYILRVEDKYYHCTWRDTLKYWDRIQLKDGYEFFNKKDSKEYRYNNGALVDISTIHLSMKINQDNIQILNSSGDGVTLPVASPTTPGLFSKEDKTKLDSITKYVKEISFSGADTLVLDIVSSDGTKSLPIREANINQNGLMSKEACLNLSRLLNTVTNNIYTKEEVQELLNKKVDVAPGKDLLDTSQIFKINQIFNYVENVEYSENNNRASLKITTKDPTIGRSSSKILSFPDTSSAISGLMSPKYKDYIDSLKSYYTGDLTKEYTGQELQIIFPIYDPISKQLTSKYLVLDAATSSTAGLITAMEKNKLGNISSIIQAVSDNTYNSNSVILNLVSNNPQTGTEEPVQIVFKSATSEKAGVMSSSDKGKLDNVVKYLTELTDTKTTSATQAIIHYQSYNPFLNSYEDKYYSLPMATSTIAGSITSTDFDVIQGLKDVNGNPLTYEGTPSKTWKIGDQILKNEKEGFSVRNEDDTEYGDLIVRNLTIKEDIVFGGSAFIIDTEEVKVTDNILTLNSGEQGEGVTKGISGLEIDRGKLPNYFIIFDESDDRFKCGTEGNQFPLMLRDNEPDMVDGAFLTWNSTFKRAQTTSTVPIQLALRFALQNLSEKDTDIIFKRVDNEIYLKYGDTNDKYLSLKVLDNILFKSSPSATKYVFDKEIWAPTFKSDNGYEVAFIDPDISDRMFLQYDSDKKTIKALNAVYTDKGGLDFFPSIDDVDNQVKLSTQNGNFDIAGLKASNAWNLVISPRVTLTREAVYKIPILDILTSSHKALGFTNPIILDSYIGFKDQSCQFYGGTDSFTFDIAGDIIRFIPSRDRSLIDTNSLELGFSTNIILPTGFRTSDLSQIVFANYWNLNKKYLAWDSNTNVITSIDGFDSLVVVNPNDPNKKLTLHYVNGGFSISSSSNVPDIEQNTIEITETTGSDGSVTYNLNSTYTPLHVNFPMWGSFCDKDGKPFATVESLVGHYLPLSAGSTNALTGPLYFSPTSALVNKTDTGENAWALFIGDSTNGTSLCLGSLGDLESLGDLRNTALLNINSSGNTHTIRLGYTDENGNIKAGIVTSGDNLSSQTVIHTIGNNDIKHYRNGAEYIIYDSSNLNVEKLLQNYTLEGNIIGTPKTTRIKGTTIPSGSDFINNFRELIWGTNDSTTWIVPFRSNSADRGLGGAYAANLGWSLGDTHAYISVSYRNDLRSVIIGGGNEGKIKWFEQVAFKSDINKLSTVYYPYSGRGHMTIREDGRPIFTNNQGILFNTTSGFIEGIYVTTNNHLNIGGIQSNNIPVDIYNKLNVNSISTTREQLGLLSYHPTDWTGVSNTQVGVGTLDSQLVFRSNSSDLLHYRDGVHCLIFDSYNFSRNLGTTSLNSSFNHFPMMAAQPSNSNATTDRGYPIQQAGSLIVIPGVYNGSSQIYGTYDSNRWFVRSGSPTSNNENEHTAWKELATTTHLSNYLPLSGGVLSGSDRIVLRINSPSSAPAVDIVFSIGNSIKSSVGFELGTLGAFLSDNVSDKVFCLKNGPEIRTNSGTLIGKIPYKSDLDKYLPLSGGTLTGRLTVPRINTNYIESMDGNALLAYHQVGVDGVTNAQVGVGTLDSQLVFRSNSSDLLHYRDGVHCLIFDSYNFSRNLGTTSLNSSFNHFPMMAAQPSNSNATTDRGYPIQQAGSLIVIPGVYNGSSQIYGTYDSNRWFVRSGSPTSNNENEHTAWKELATTTHLSNYLPLSGGVLSGSDRIVLRINSPSSAPAVDIVFSIGNSIKSSVGFELGTLGAFLSDNVSDKVFCLKNGPEIRTNSGTLIGKIPYKSDLDKYLPLSGGTLTGRLTVPRINTNYIESMDGNALLAYHQVGVDGVTNAQVGIGTVVDQMILRSSNTNLMHYKNGTQYTILDTSNIAALTIQFNGSTNTTYAPNGAKTVNITPAAIGAAAVGHTHVMSDISGLSLAWSSITGKPETATRWPSWSEVTNKPINPSYSFGGNNDSITTAQFLTHLQNLGAFSTGFGIYRGSWSYMANQSITDTGVGVIHLAGSTVEVIGNSASNCTIRVTVPTTSGNGTTKRIYVYCNNGDDYKPGWFAVARTDELTWNSISGKPSTFTPSSHTHTKSQITDFPSSMPASDVYAWAKASSKPSYSYSEVGAAAASHTHTTIRGTYTGSGGSQPPSYVTAGTLRANMMYYNMSGSPYCDWLMMDTYIGSDVPYVTMIGVTKTATPRAFIASGPKGNASTSSWVRKELATVDAIPTTMAWGNITGVPETATRWPSWSEVTNKPSTFTPSSHTHPLSGISDLQASWDALLKAAPSAYVTRWPSWSEVTNKPSFATVAASGSYNDLSNKPSIPSAETAATIMSKINSQSEITFSKHVVCSAGAGTSSTSDIRFKSNFNSLPDDTLNKVLNAPEFTYNWKDETTTSIGTSAQYWEDKIPELVHEMEDGTKTFSYERYTVVLQKALKEEHRLREEERKKFKEDINSLNTRLNDLTSLIQKLI